MLAAFDAIQSDNSSTIQSTICSSLAASPVSRLRLVPEHSDSWHPL
jgi:hypothetical protein